MSALGEFGIIERYFTRAFDDRRCLLGIGDDAAIVDGGGPLAIAVDMLVAGTHFPLGFDPHAVGYRALAVNLSDLAAMGARPRWATLALSLPEADPDFLAAFAGGFFELAERCGVALIGGDTTRGPLSTAVQLIGDAPPRPLLRSSGRAGDLIFVTGTPGDAAAGLAQLAQVDAERSSAAADLIARFSYPEPRLAFGQALAGIGAAAIDISDGLLADLGHICEQSQCGASIDVSALPLSAALLAVHGHDAATGFALSGGDDYELCFAVAPRAARRVQAAAESTATPVTEIGRLTGEPGIRALRDGLPVAMSSAGFTHF